MQSIIAGSSEDGVLINPYPLMETALRHLRSLGSNCWLIGEVNPFTQNVGVLFLIRKL